MKRSVFAALFTLSAAALVACLFLAFGVWEKSNDFEERFAGIGRTVVTLSNEFRDATEQRHFFSYENMREVVGKLLDVSGVFLSRILSQDGSKWLTSVRNPHGITAMAEGVGPGYNKHRGLTIKEGRFLEQGDEGMAVGVIRERMADELLVRVGDKVVFEGQEIEIIGIVAESKPFDVSITPFGDVLHVPVALKRQLDVQQRPSGFVMPIYTARLIYLPGTRDALLSKARVVLGDKFGHDNRFSVGEDQTALGYLRLLRFAWLAGLLLIGALSLVIGAKTLKAYLTLARRGGPTAPLALAIAATIIGVWWGIVACRVLLGSFDIPVVQAVLAIGLGTGLPVFIAKIWMKKASFLER